MVEGRKMIFKTLVKHIRSLKWEELTGPELQTLMLLSAHAAREFAESLRISLGLYPKHSGFQEVAKGELETDNLGFADYHRAEDHSEFLWHFIEKYGTNQTSAVKEAGEAYIQQIRLLPAAVRAMSIVSRERELPRIFAQILEAPDWSAPGLKEFRHYLKRHIALDSGIGGHSELLDDFKVTDEVVPFYEARLKLYRCLPNLFTKTAIRLQVVYDRKSALVLREILDENVVEYVLHAGHYILVCLRTGEEVLISKSTSEIVVEKTKIL